MFWDFSMIRSFGRLAVAELQCGVNGRLNPIGRRSTSNETCKFPPHHVPGRWSSITKTRSFGSDRNRLPGGISSPHFLDFIKLDIPGAEAMAIRGAEQTLVRDRDIQLVMEYAPRQMHLNWREIHSACRKR